MQTILDKSFLSEKQIEALSLFRDGKNVFITGPGGTGKSTLIDNIYREGMLCHRRIYVTALTGQAAQNLKNVSAITINRWAGVGICKGDAKEIITKALNNKRAYNRWLHTDCLVVDEVSMLSEFMFDLLDKLGKSVMEKAIKYDRNGTQREKYLRRNRSPDLPFGGLQLIFSGDFYQLPPVKNTFCFQSPIWFDVFPESNHILLKQIYRQAGDAQVPFRNLLSRVRKGLPLQPKQCKMLEERVQEPPEDMIVPIFLPINRQVDTENNMRLEKLGGECVTYTLSKIEARHISQIITSTDNQTVLGVSCDENYNRSVYIHKKNSPPEGAKSTDLLTYTEYTRQDIEDDYKDLRDNISVPDMLQLKVGAQIMCVINKEKTDADGVPEYTLYNGLQGRIVEFTDNLDGIIVKFNGISQEVLLEKYIWESNKIPGVAYTGFPIILSWAMTIHKAQGSTHDAAVMDLGDDVFEEGQCYVALSRVRNLSGLYLKRFSKNSIKANKHVTAFYELFKKRSANTLSNETDETPVKDKEEEKGKDIHQNVESVRPATTQQKDIRGFFRIPQECP